MEELIKLYQSFKGTAPEQVVRLPESASARKYFRLKSGADSLIGTFSPDTGETKAFTTFTNHFHRLGIHVPEIVAVSDDLNYYLQQDLGDDRLYERIRSAGKNVNENRELIQFFKKALKELVRMQVEGGAGLDYSLCVPRSSFDRQSMLWDLNHFKYYFLKLSGLPFDEDLLEKDFLSLASFLSEQPMKHFMFRDCQSRNILIHNNEIFFVDYQGGRRGPLQYDLASLLFEAKTRFSESVRQELLNEYMDEASPFVEIDRKVFTGQFYWWALIRILQALGAFGIRGTIQKKAIFLQSIPYGLENLGTVLDRLENGPALPELYRCLHELVQTAPDYPVEPETGEGLTVSVTSFSYRKGYPDDLSGNGGGFVYDCRLLSNPGKYEEYKDLTGFDREVEEFFTARGDMEPFLNNVKQQLRQAVHSTLEQGYKHLSVSFGCTGGKHRSVYASRKISEFLKTLDNVRVIETHRELKKMNR
ncbi:MAG: phosphotransferase [Bacteroidales bacterium]|nr:phosphotransferase [Bacteroidales bacterium]